MLPSKRRKLPMPEERAQGLVEYALILILAAIIVIGALAVFGSSIETTYCKIVGMFPGSENPCAVDVVDIFRADYDKTKSPELHLDARFDGDYHPDVTLTASPGGTMEAKAHHYHLDISLSVSDCPCEVTVTSSAGGSTSVTVGPEPPPFADK
jgi:Flp pilus assembly pilin Flp